MHARNKARKWRSSVSRRRRTQSHQCGAGARTLLCMGQKQEPHPRSHDAIGDRAAHRGACDSFFAFVGSTRTSAHRRSRPRATRPHRMDVNHGAGHPGIVVDDHDQVVQVDALHHHEPRVHLFAKVVTKRQPHAANLADVAHGAGGRGYGLGCAHQAQRVSALSQALRCRQDARCATLPVPLEGIDPRRRYRSDARSQPFATRLSAA